MFVLTLIKSYINGENLVRGMKLQTAKGVQDYAPEEKIVRNEVVSVLKEVFERYGFLPLETPTLERYETLAAKYAGGAEILRETFKYPVDKRSICYRKHQFGPRAA